MGVLVIKRSGELVNFAESKITDAIAKAGKATSEFDHPVAITLTAKVVEQIKTKSDESVTVETIQDLVEDVLLETQYKRTAKAYVLYRAQHAQMRNIAEAAHIDLMDKYLDKLDWQVKENSNMSYSLQGLNNYVASEITKTYWLEKIYPKEVRDAHTNGDVHIHDLNLLSVYCVGWDLMDLLVEGFKGVPGKTASAPAKHFRSALGQIVNFFYTLQGEAAGAQAFSSFDTLLAPFIGMDNLSYKEVKQALQEFVFNINVPTRVGFQTPFTNITMDLNPPAHFSDMPVVIGGVPHETLTYKDFQKEMDILNKAFLEVMVEGDAQGRVFTFPIPTYNITEDFDWDNPVVETLWEATAKYGIPYFSNFINSDMNPEDSRSMCCRLRIDNRQLEYRGGGLFGANPLTGSIGVTTLNMPRVGLQAKTENEYFDKVKELMDICKESLEIKRKYLEKLTDNNLYPYTKFYLRDIKAAQGTYWCNHFSTIGLLGMNESVENFLGENIASDKGKKFSEKVLEFMRDTLVEYQQETGQNYNLEATPAEGTCYRLALLDQKRFDNAIFANGKGKDIKTPFYTNSSHLPVNYTDDLFELLELQDELQTKYTGGTVIHFFLGERASNSQALKSMVRMICKNYRLPYFTFTPSFSVCANHGYLNGEQHICPTCHEPAEVYSRVVGYLRSVSQWNDGKRAEFDMREHYRVETKPQKALVHD
jgi:anaerobic ribonucleoside-triphosphate reductase